MAGGSSGRAAQQPADGRILAIDCGSRQLNEAATVQRLQYAGMGHQRVQHVEAVRWLWRPLDTGAGTTGATARGM
jgi:hypothetical protein